MEVDFSPIRIELSPEVIITVTPKEETNLIDLKEGEGDPVVKWTFSWQFNNKNWTTRLGYNKIENKILAMNDPDHKPTVFLETVHGTSFAGEIHRFFPYSPLPAFNDVKQEVIRIILKKLGGGTVITEEKKSIDVNLGIPQSSKKGNE